jgi:hypothetical protein
MKFVWREKTLPAYIKYVEETYKDDTLLVFSKYQISSDNPIATGLRVTVKDIVNLWGDTKTQGVIDEIVDKGSYLFSSQDRKDLGIDHLSYPFTETEKMEYKVPIRSSMLGEATTPHTDLETDNGTDSRSQATDT